MGLKNVVKVMNFHALLRVDSARKKAEKYFESEIEITKMIDNIIHNRNLVLDKKSLQLDDTKPPLDIYIGNDFGFCGTFNTSINSDLKNNNDSYKILIGKKINHSNDKILLNISKEEFNQKFNQVEKIIYEAINSSQYSKINVIYNHYYSVNNLGFVRKTIFPVSFDSNDNSNTYTEDFVVETDINEMLVNLVTLYICYEIRIAQTNSWAAENIMRQQITKESLKKIDEMEITQMMQLRKIVKYKSFKKIIENYRKLT
jgi:F0F1-type ATP synthase gamma subunit